MPSYITHRYFGEQVERQLGDFPGKRFIQEHRVAYLWGVQGPDLLFYLPKNEDAFFVDIGGIMHRSHTDRLFAQLSQMLIEKKDEPIYPALASYVYGFLCHYCLDRNVHEYVYCAIDDLAKTYKTSSPFGVHIKLETDMDTAFYREFHGGNVRRFKLEPELLTCQEDIDAIAAFHAAMITQVFDYPMDEARIRSCVPGFFAREKSNFDPLGVRSWIRLRMKEIRAREYHTSTVNWRPSTVRRDVLNKRRRPWVNPWYPDRVRTDSVLDIFQASVQDACTLIRTVEEHTQSGVPFTPKNMVSFDNGNPKYYPNYEND